MRKKQLESDALNAVLTERLPQFTVREPIQHQLVEMMATFSGGGDSSSVRQKGTGRGFGSNRRTGRMSSSSSGMD